MIDLTQIKITQNNSSERPTFSIDYTGMFKCMSCVLYSLSQKQICNFDPYESNCYKAYKILLKQNLLEQWKTI